VPGKPKLNTSHHRTSPQDAGQQYTPLSSAVPEGSSAGAASGLTTSPAAGRQVGQVVTKLHACSPFLCGVLLVLGLNILQLVVDNCMPIPSWLFVLQVVSPDNRQPAEDQQQGAAGPDLSQLQLQGSAEPPACSPTSSSDASKLAAGTAAPGSPGAADEGVSQSRASSQIRVKKFHKLLSEQLVGPVPDGDAIITVAGLCWCRLQEAGTICQSSIWQIGPAAAMMLSVVEGGFASSSSRVLCKRE